MNIVRVTPLLAAIRAWGAGRSLRITSGSFGSGSRPAISHDKIVLDRSDVFTQPRPTSDIRPTEIPQRSSPLVCYPFPSEAREFIIIIILILVLLGRI
jgi:hypothetical protein